MLKSFFLLSKIKKLCKDASNHLQGKNSKSVKRVYV